MGFAVMDQKKDTYPSGRRKKVRRDTVIGTAIKQKRMALGMTQLDLGRELELDYISLISQIENGYIPVPASLWGPIATALNFKREDWILMCLQEHMPEVYEALFDSKDKTVTARFLKNFNAD